MAVGALHLSGYRNIKNLWGLWMLLFLLVRPPYQMTLRIMAWMENLSIKSASLIMDYGSVIHGVQGNVLSLPHHDFEIDAICSGWVSLVSTVATAAVICVVKNRPLLHTVMVLMLAVVSTWILNVLRIMAIVSINLFYQIDCTAAGAYSVFYQLSSFLAAFVFVLSADALTVFILSNVNREGVGPEIKEFRRGHLAKLWMSVSSFEASSIFARFSSATTGPLRVPLFSLLIFCLGGLMVIEAVALYYRPMITGKQVMFGEDQLTKIGKESVVFDRTGWEVIDYNEERRDFASVWGALSSTWRLKYNGITVIMSLDYPFDDWHDVKACYHNIGWAIKDEKIVSQLPLYAWGASETDMILPNGDAGFILCSHSDHIGNIVEPKPATHDHTMLLYRLRPSEMTAPFGGTMDKNTRTFYQTQCMVATPVPLDEAMKQEIRVMYAQFREQTRKAIGAKSKQNQVK